MPTTIIDELLQMEIRKRRRGGMPLFRRTLRDMMADDGYEGEAPLRVHDGPDTAPPAIGTNTPKVKPRSDPFGPGATHDSVRASIMDSFRSGSEIILPSLDKTTYRFPDSGARVLLELMFADRSFLDMIAEKEKIDEMEFVRAHHLFRTDGRTETSMTSEALLRGLSPLCELLVNGSCEFDPSENDWRYLDSVLGLLCCSDSEGRVRSWTVDIGGTKHSVRCEASKGRLDYSYDGPSP